MCVTWTRHDWNIVTDEKYNIGYGYTVVYITVG